ncbi:hypothetical protein [Mucilaginibacter puniceus]
MERIQKTLYEKSADNIIIDGWKVSYKGSTSSSRHSLFGGITGTFTFSKEDSLLIYKYFCVELFVFSSSVGVIAGLFGGLSTGDWWIGLIAFCWLGGINWIVNFIRHNGLVDQIVDEINKLFTDEIVVEE